MATKKIKKVETPIDQRETFVSLQKSFADSEVNTQEKLKVLYALQEADTAIDKIVQLRGELPSEVESLEQEVASMEGKVAQLEELVEAFSNSIVTNTQDIASFEGQIEKYQKQLESIANSREFDSINKEIENQDLLRQIARKNIGEAKIKIEEKKDEIEFIKAKLEARKEDLEAKKQELSSIVDSTSEEEARLVARREACASKIDARTMSAYERIRASVYNHLAVVPVFNESACGGCFSTITPQRLIDIASGNKLIICEHCGRIIINPNIED